MDADMGRFGLLLLLLLSLIAAFAEVSAQDDEDASNVATNLRFTAYTRSMDVSWDAPASHLEDLDSYRVRVYPADEDVGKRIYWVLKTETLTRTVDCLEPNARYKVQVVTRFFKSSNISDGVSDSITAETLPETEAGFLSRVWEQRVYVMIGAIMMVLAALFFIPCICCCYCYCAKRSGSTRERLVEDEVRCTKDPVHGFDVRMNSSFGSSPPPSYSHTTMRSPERPPLPAPSAHDTDPDLDDDYQNDVFLPPPPASDTNIYGNINVY